MANGATIRLNEAQQASLKNPGEQQQFAIDEFICASVTWDQDNDHCYFIEGEIVSYAKLLEVIGRAENA